MSHELSHLDALEAEAIHIMREVAAELERPVLLFSGGKDSIVLLRLAEKAFRPARFPFPLMHVDTGHNFPEVIEFRDRRVAELGERLIVASVQDSIDNGRVVEETGPRASRNRLQTVTLLDAIEEHGFDAAFGGARRDEEKARAKERIFSFRDDFGQWDPKNQRPELWNLYNGRVQAGRARARVPALELDRARRLAVHRRARSSSCRRSTSPTSARCSRATGCSTPSSDFVELLRRRGAVRRESVRFRTVGDMTCTGAVALRRGDARRRRRRDRRHADHRARRDARRRPRLRGRDGRPQEGGLLLMAARRGHQRTADGRLAPPSCVRFATAGSVDDGKSTLIGRLLLRHQVDLRGPARARRGDARSGAATAT